MTILRFITRLWSPELGSFLTNYEKKNRTKIDLLIMNSCLWDVNRWGPDGPRMFKENLNSLLELLPTILPDMSMFLWLTTPPGMEIHETKLSINKPSPTVSSVINSRGMNLPGLEFQRITTRYHVIESSLYTGRVGGCRKTLLSIMSPGKLVSSAGYSVVDLCHHMQGQGAR